MKTLLIGMAALPFLAGAASAALSGPPNNPACPVSLEYVLGTDHNLWREYSDRSTQFNVGHRLLVDRDVAQFQALWCSNIVYVLNTDGTLWRTNPITSNTQPTKIDADVSQFQIMGDDTAYVLKTDGSLWRDQPNQSPQRVNENVVVQFQAVDYTVALSGVNSVVTDMYVLDSKGNLRQDGKLLDQNVLHFQVDTHGNVYVLYTNNRLYRRYPGGRQFVDWTVLAFQALDETTVYVLRMDGNLYKTGNPNAVGQGVRSFQVLAPASVDILWADRTLSNNLESYDIDANVLGFQNDQAPFQAAGLPLPDRNQCPPNGPVTQSSPNPSPPCIYILPTTSSPAVWTAYADTPDCNHLWNICTWDFLTTFDRYNVKYGPMSVNPSNWAQLQVDGRDGPTLIDHATLPNLLSLQMYGMMIQGALFCDIQDWFTHGCTDWTSWSDIKTFWP
jgi:hypothetical protein